MHIWHQGLIFSSSLLFLSTARNNSRCIFTSSSSSSPYSSFSMLFVHSAFLLCSFHCHILFQSSFASIASGCWYVLVHSPSSCWYVLVYSPSSCWYVLVHSSTSCWLNFLCYFGKSSFDCVTWPCLGIS